MPINDINGRIRQRIVAAGTGAKVTGRQSSPVAGRIVTNRPEHFKRRVEMNDSTFAKRLKKLASLPSFCDMSRSGLVKHSMRIAGHATSVSLEAPFWEALCEIADRRGKSVGALVAAIDQGRNGNLSSAIRVFVLESCRRGELSGAECPGLPRAS